MWIFMCRSLELPTLMLIKGQLPGTVQTNLGHVLPVTTASCQLPASSNNKILSKLHLDFSYEKMWKDMVLELMNV